MHLPAAVCDRLDRINRNFLWGDSPDKKKIHLVKWDKVCKSKDSGGLGLKKAKDQNLAFLTKLGWKITNQEEGGLWVSILSDKYLSKHSISTWPNRPASHLWRSIVDTKQVLEKGVKWVIGDGKSVSIWHDWWVGDKPLALYHLGEHTNYAQKVETLIIMDGNWVLEEIAQYVDVSTLEAINAINLSIY